MRPRDGIVPLDECGGGNIQQTGWSDFEEGGLVWRVQGVECYVRHAMTRNASGQAEGI